MNAEQDNTERWGEVAVVAGLALIPVAGGSLSVVADAIFDLRSSSATMPTSTRASCCSLRWNVSTLRTSVGAAQQQSGVGGLFCRPTEFGERLLALVTLDP